MTTISPQRNQFLSELAVADYQQLLPSLHTVLLKRGQILYAQDSSPDFIYFPVSVVISFVVELSDGFSIEAVALGKESIVGAAIPATGSVGILKVRDEGIAFKVKVTKFDHLLKNISVSKVVTKFNIGIIEMMMRNIACVRHHKLIQQLCRWILNSLNSAKLATITISHAELGHTLGVRREAISLTLNELALSGAVELKRNHIEVVDREILEKMVCECYWASITQ